MTGTLSLPRLINGRQSRRDFRRPATRPAGRTRPSTATGTGYCAPRKPPVTLQPLANYGARAADDGIADVTLSTYVTSITACLPCSADAASADSVEFVVTPMKVGGRVRQQALRRANFAFADGASASIIRNPLDRYQALSTHRRETAGGGRFHR